MDRYGQFCSIGALEIIIPHGSHPQKRGNCSEGKQINNIFYLISSIRLTWINLPASIL